MVERIFLSGGGDEKQSFEVDKQFLKGIKTILYIPQARKEERFPDCLEWITHALHQHKKVNITMAIDLTAPLNLSKFDAIYVGGGNTYRLLKKIKETKFDKKLIEYYQNGGTIYGGSAGAIIWGRDINTASIGFDSDKNETNLKDTSGLEILSATDIQCHYRVSQLKKHKEYATKTGRNIIAIPEGSAVLIDGNIPKVIGKKPVYVIYPNKATKHHSGEIIQP